MGVSYDPIWKNSGMAFSLDASQPAVALISPAEGDFYMATFRGGRIQKVGCKMKDGPPLRVRRVLDFNSKVELAKEQALTLKRKQLGSGLELQARSSGKKEKTLAEVMLEMKRKKTGGALATVQRQPPAVTQVTRVYKTIPMAEMIPPREEVAVEEVIPMEEEVPMEEEIPVIESSPRAKKRKRKSTSKLHTSSELLVLPAEHPTPQREDEITLAEWLKKSVVSTTGRASSDNAGIKVFQRRKVKFKAIRRRPSRDESNVCSRGEDNNRPSSPVTVCENVCDCEECRPNDISATKTPTSPCRNVHHPTTCSRVSTVESSPTHISQIEISIITIDSDDHPGGLSTRPEIEELSFGETDHLSREDLSIGEFDTLTLPDDSSQVPVALHGPPIHESDIEKKFLEEFCGEVAQQAPSGVAAPSSDFSCRASPAPLDTENSWDDRCVGAPCLGPEFRDTDMPEEPIAKTRSHLILETSTGDIGQGSFVVSAETPTCPSAENSASVVTPMELAVTEVRIDAILDTLVTPDELLPIHLSASKSTLSKSIKQKKKRNLCETVTLDMLPVKEGSSLGAVNIPGIFQKQEEDLTEQISLNLRERILKYVTVNPPNSGSDLMEGESVVSTERVLKSVTVDLTSSETDIIEELPLSDTTQSSELLVLEGARYVSEEHGLAHEPVVSFEEIRTPTTCLTNAEAVFPSFQRDTPLNAEERSLDGNGTLLMISDAVEITRTPVTSPIKSGRSNEDSAICLSTSGGLDAAEGGASGTSASKALFSSLTTDGLSKRNRKSFSPNSRLALIEAARSEKATPTFKIKLMKSKMGDSRSGKLVSGKKAKRKTFPLQDHKPIPDDSSAQDGFQSDVKQVQLVASSDSHPPSPLQPTENGSPDLIAPFFSEPLLDMSALAPDSSIRTVPGSPEYQNEPSVSLQTDVEPFGICTPDSSVGNRTCTEGTLIINVDCRPDSPTDPCTPNATVVSPPQPKSILKTRSVDPDMEVVTCRGVCKCPRCLSTRDQSEAARDFIKSQMNMANNITSKLITELRNMRALVEDDGKPHAEGESSTLFANPSEKAMGALESATKTETWATKEILKLSRDSKRVCRLIETGPRRTIFADDAGRQLCHVKILPAKKNTIVHL